MERVGCRGCSWHHQGRRGERTAPGVQESPQLGGGTSGGHCHHPDARGQPELPGGATMNPPSPFLRGPKKRLQKLSCKGCRVAAPRRGPACSSRLATSILFFACFWRRGRGGERSFSKLFESLMQSLLGGVFGDDLPIESGWGARCAAGVPAGAKGSCLLCCRFVEGPQPPDHGGTGHPARGRRLHRDRQRVLQRGRPQQVGAARRARGAPAGLGLLERLREGWGGKRELMWPGVSRGRTLLGCPG